MKKVAALLALVLAAAAVTACGDDDNGTTTETGSGEAANGAAAGGGAAGGGSQEGDSSTLAFEADPDGGLAYTSDEATAEAGNVTVDFTNPQQIAHDVAIETPDGEQVGKTEIVTDDSDSTTVDLKPGEYTFYCTVPGHREAGMEGTLTVE